MGNPSRPIGIDNESMNSDSPCQHTRYETMIPEICPAFQTSPVVAAILQTPPKNPAPFAILAHNEIEALRKAAGSLWCLYSVLALHANDRGDCWPGRQRLATLTGMHPDHVSRALSQLESRGLITRRSTDDGLTIYHLPLHRRRPALPLPNLVAEAAQPLPNLVGITDHVSTDHRESATPEPATPESAEQPLSPVVLRTCKTPPPDTVPDAWLTLGAELRPDLDACVIETSADRFLNLRRAQGVMLTHWTPAWRNWIKGEYGPKPVTPATSAHSKPYAIQQPSPYAGWENGKPAPIGAPTTPESDIAAFERDMRSYGAEKQADGTWRRPAPLIERPVVTPEPRPTVSVMPPLSGNSRLREKAARIAALMDSGLSLEEVRALEAQRATREG